jgi:hypothetical protein
MIEKSKIECGTIFKQITGIDAFAQEKFFYFCTDSGNYLEIFSLLVEIINSYGFISAVGLGKEYNPHNRSRLMLDKLGFFGQLGMRDFSKNNKLNLNDIFENERIYFSHYVGFLNNEDTFYQLIHNKVDKIYLEIIEEKASLQLNLKNDYIGVVSKSSVRILFGFDLKENLYLILGGEEVFLNKIRGFYKTKFNEASRINDLIRVTYLDKDFLKSKRLVEMLGI